VQEHAVKVDRFAWARARTQNQQLQRDESTDALLCLVASCVSGTALDYICMHVLSLSLSLSVALMSHDQCGFFFCDRLSATPTWATAMGPPFKMYVACISLSLSHTRTRTHAHERTLEGILRARLTICQSTCVRIVKLLAGLDFDTLCM